VTSVIIGSGTLTNNNQFIALDVDVEGNPPQTYARVNFTCTLTMLPKVSNQWFMTRRKFDLANDDGYGIEAYFNKPKNDYIDLTIELRDLLTNKLQPVMAIPGGRVLPPFTYIFDIY